MGGIKLKYGPEDKPPLFTNLLFGLQWLAITIPTVIIIGQVVSGLHFTEAAAQVNYVQKVFFITGVALLAQLFWGHRLPLIIGPATVLLVGIVASQSSSISAVYTAILIGGVALALLSLSGLFARLHALFTSRVVAAILILIALTLTPTILNLILNVPQPGQEFGHFIFALVFVTIMFAANRILKGIWKSTLIIWALVIGSLLYLVAVPQYQWLTGAQFPACAHFLTGFSFQFSLDAGVLISFLVCFLALSINDLGSVQSVGRLVKAPQMTRRITAGITVTGLSNVLAGALSVIGPVNFSLSAGIITSNGNASRFTLVPTGIGLLLISLLPGTVALISSLPPVIIGIVLLYIMCSQLSAGLIIALGSKRFTFEDGVIIGLPLMLGIIVSFLPASALAGFPPLLVPILGNGFVVGVVAVLLMEHLIYRR